MSNDNTITGLRDIMFDTLRGVKNGTIEIDKAKAINDTAQTIINSAKVEVEFLKATGSPASTGFIGGDNKMKEITNTPTGTKVVEKDPESGVTTTVHRMRG
ncbi:MAG: hypothetical protein U1D54_03885 [Limnobacter sp.]|nr:hypothetical protein [Limnobacter sp.]